MHTTAGNFSIMHKQNYIEYRRKFCKNLHKKMEIGDVMRVVFTIVALIFCMLVFSVIK